MTESEKTLMKVKNIDSIQSNYDETGMGFQIAESNSGLLALLADGSALPYYADPIHYSIDDYLKGNPIPKKTDNVNININSVYLNRASSLNALINANISSRYTGSVGALPLIASYTLQNATVFYRYRNTKSDPNYSNGVLKKNTHLTTSLDQIYSNSGFAAVGRYALPFPLPASYVIQYQLPKGTSFLVGSVLPMFGQSGGGVEVCIPNSQQAKQIGNITLQDY